MICNRCTLAVCLGFLLAAPAAHAAPITIDFEDLIEFTAVTNQYAGSGALFTNATALTAGTSLNDIDFPPHSGVNSVIDDGGPITIAFSSPISSFSGFFTYITTLTLTGFDTGNTPVASMSSAFSSNIGSDVGSVPNELLTVTFAGGLSKVQIEGDSGGTSFFLDDATIAPLDAAVPVPEPATVFLLGTGVVAACRRRGFGRCG